MALSQPPDKGTPGGPVGLALPPSSVANLVRNEFRFDLRRLSILMANGDAVVLATLPLVLETLGHQVKSVSRWFEALVWIREHPRVDLVLLDQNMPGLNELQSIRLIRECRSQVRVLLVTDHPKAIPSAMLASDPRLRVLPKPFSVKKFKLKMEDFNLQNNEFNHQNH